ncbi:MAG: glycoside hydrolase family 127 protein [Tannerellaceae bacterium]|nr:glycoside hydrolase family 127 protein [Tannerellaceae bacterium]
MTRFKPFISCICAATAFIACTSSSTGKSAMDYSLLAEEYKPRLVASDPSSWKPVPLSVSVPEGGVEVDPDGLFRPALERNAHYLLTSFSNDHLLYPFRIRAGVQNPPDDRPQIGFWDTDLRGSNAGRFMMGAGNTLRWISNPELRARLDDLIDGIEACREEDGYILAYPHIIDSLRSEEPNYARAWFTHGLIDAAIAGNPKAYSLLRGHADWFNNWNELHPKLLYWNHNSHQGHIASTRTYLSPIGKPEDLQLAEKYYVCDWWMDELAARRDSAIWQYPLQNPHSYLVTSFEAYLDHYIATGEKVFLNAMLGAWDLIHDNWEHVGGTMAICENQWFVEDGHRVLKDFGNRGESSHPPRSYYLDSHRGHTGETCGSAFWIKFNQRLHRLFPDEEKYVAEIEKSIYNAILAVQTEDGCIGYHSRMSGRKDHPDNGFNSCCEGQGTRLLGSLPEYIYSIASDGGLYINIYEPSTIQWVSAGKSVSLRQSTRFPYDSSVALALALPSPVKMKLRIRIPSWASSPVDVYVNDKKISTGKPGSYLPIDRQWSDGDRISFSLPMQVKTTRYEGLDTLPGMDRYASEYGPLLLASVSPGTSLPQFADARKLVADPARPLHFLPAGATSPTFMPYLLINRETFSVYPANVKLDEDFSISKHVTNGSFSVEFFANEKWEGVPVYTGSTPEIDYPDEGTKPIAPGVPVEHFSSRFTGEFTAPFTGTLYFVITTDDGYSFLIDDKEVAHSHSNTNDAPQYCNIEITEGSKYNLCFKHSQGTGEYRIILKAFRVKSS